MAQNQPYGTASYPSPRSSPSHSTHDDQLATSIPIDVLIAYLVAAKRSLSSIHLVHRATTILSEARSTIESTAATVARTKYLRRSLASQIKILRGIQYEIEGTAQTVKSEIQALVTELEQIDQKLQENVESLKATKIEAAFKQNQSHTGTDVNAISKDTLHDFVDDEPVEKVTQSIQAAINDIETAETKIDASIRMLEDDLQSANASLDNERTVTSSSTDSNLKPLSVSRTLKSLETNAHEMAVSLESLVRHFDLCVTAIKHTEGAGAIAAKAVDAEDLPNGVDVNDLILPTQEQELTPEERAEMLSVLQNDAGEVDEVVLEMQDRAAEMENTLVLLFQWRDKRQATYDGVNTAFNLLDRISSRLASHVADLNAFRHTWQDVAERITDGQIALAELSDTYTGFLDSYDGLIVEAARRRAVKKQMLKIVNEAHTKLEQLYEEDLNERHIFRTERGDFLPSDIWSGLGDLPSKWTMVRIDGARQEGDSGHGEDSIPELPRRTVEEALRRLRRKVEGEISSGNSQTRSHSGSTSRVDARS